MKRRRRTVFVSIVSVPIFFILVWAYYPILSDSSLTFKWEGALSSKTNFRDTGVSINSCGSQGLLPEGKLFRANQFFSGWSCDQIGSPDVILSLNYNDQDSRKFYCRGQDGLLVGEYFQSRELSDLEFLETWSREPEFVTAACKHLSRAMQAINDNQKVLIHCEAGRDRTGAVSALLAALIWENANYKAITDEVIDAIECDYRKSPSLRSDKYGRVKQFLQDIRQKYTDTRQFFEVECAGR